MSKLKPLVHEVRGNALWDGIKLVLYIAGVALMSTGALAAFIRYVSAIPTDVWMIVGIFILSFLFIGSAFVISRRGNRSAETLSVEEEERIPVADVEMLQGRIKELERELEEETRKYKFELNQKETLRKHRDDLEARWESHVFSNRRLFAKREAQGQSISSYVEVEKVYFCYQELEKPMLKSVFGIDFRNKSIFDISIEEKVGKHIKFEGVELEVSPRIISHPGTVKTGEIGKITLEQRLTRCLVP